MRLAPRVQLRRDQPSDLPAMLAEGHRYLRALRPGPPAPGALARRAGLRPVLHRPLRHRGQCASCGAQRRLVCPPDRTLTPAQTAPGSRSRTPAPAGIEDKLYERGRCARCSLQRRATALLAGADGQIPAGLTPVLEAICAARNPRSALNWLRRRPAPRCLPTWPPGSCPPATRRWTPIPAGGPRTSSATCSPRAVLPPATRNSLAPGSGDRHPAGGRAGHGAAAGPRLRHLAGDARAARQRRRAPGRAPTPPTPGATSAPPPAS